ncbi:MAG TPA: UDP-2,3-diacylglucosamine diphosphatase LpxI [Planctomycetaceae bacterium]|nr:UDP-2,3-diacylglucosamine diphosphatase LpxI [Planctomycetaceae bacterium]
MTDHNVQPPDILPMMSTEQKSAQSPRRIGLLAGAGSFPIEFARAARRQGYQVIAVAPTGMVSEELREYCEYMHVGSLARIGKAISVFKRKQVKEIVMAGKIEKKVMLNPWVWFQHLPDWRAVHMMWKYARRDRKDDTLLLAVIQEFARDGLHFQSALKFCPELLVSHGFLTKRHPSSSQWKDINFAWEIAKEMGRLDVGQSIAVSERAVIAVEAIEGTDECIRRAGTLCRKGGFTVVKVAKPQQDMRFDVPTIGIQTIQTMREAGARVLAIESERTIVLDQDEVVQLADKVGIAIVSLNANESELRIAS